MRTRNEIVCVPWKYWQTRTNDDCTTEIGDYEYWYDTYTGVGYIVKVPNSGTDR